jgi:two-component system phosphate regulon sensor histidine kinase PhoR
LLTFPQRILFSLLAVMVTSLATAPMMLWGWGGFISAQLLRLLAVWALYSWLKNSLAEQHGHFLAVLQDLRSSLPTGREALHLKSHRPEDSFGTLATELNSLVDEASLQISHQLEQNRNLEQNKTLFQSILGTMIEGVFVLDSQNRVLYFNDAARRVLDCTSRSVEGRPVWEVVRATELHDAVNTVVESGREFRKEVELNRNRCVVEVTVVQLPLQPQPGTIVVLHDVTELRRLERMRREFVSNVSHELKTPLTSIQASADTLMDGGLEDAENGRLFVSRILEQSERLQNLIQDMLRLARIESQSEAFQLRPVLVGEIIPGCVDARTTVARSRHIELRLASGDPSLEVLADPSGLQTIVDNLVSNALNHTREGGRIDVSWHSAGEDIVIEVADDGIGIAGDHLERIFERFYRVDKARSRGIGGTGLGLAIVKHLASVFGGSIHVRSEVGKGSTFEVRLPRLEQSALPAETHSEPRASPSVDHDAF